MNNTHSNPCTRCGKERIVVKTWQEKIGYSMVTTTEAVCPDIKCQRMVNKSNKDRENKYEASKLKRKMSLSRPKKVGIHDKIVLP